MAVIVQQPTGVGLDDLGCSPDHSEVHFKVSFAEKNPSALKSANKITNFFRGLVAERFIGSRCTQNESNPIRQGPSISGNFIESVDLV